MLETALMTRRSGMSLTEVLVALFILTIGVIGILTMFPLGAAQMARAVRDDRSALAATNADGFMRWYWATYVANPVITSGGSNPNFGTSDPYLVNGTGLFDNPAQTGGAGVASLPNLSLNGANTNQVSYPVIVDPMGYATGRNWNFGDSSTYAAIPRYGLNAGGSPFQSQPFSFFYRNCSLLDSLGYNENGTPTPDREMRYNFLWVLQRPQMMTEMTSISPNNLYNSNNTSITNMTVVVFDRRPPQYPPASFQGFEVVMGASLTTGSTTVAISAANSAQALDLKAGSWVMDASSNNGVSPPIRQANFYRVVSVVQAGGVVNLELQSPIAAPTGYPPLGFTYQGTLVAMSGVSGVFVRAPLTPYPQ
jgi:type II secretory pathway pseudopilin PulG